MTATPRDAAFFARVEQSTKSRKENPWLNGLGLNEDDLFTVRTLQNTYVVQLDDYPDVGYKFSIKMLWDYDRLWGIFDFGHTKGVFLVDPGVNPSMCEDDSEDDAYGGGQELPFTWREVYKDILLCNELITKGKIRINPWNTRLEGFFECMQGNGSAAKNSKTINVPFMLNPILGQA